MAAGFLTARMFVFLLLSELDVSSAFPSARSSVYPEVWPSVRSKPEGFGYGNRRPLEYVQALRQLHREPRSGIQDQAGPGLNPHQTHQTASPAALPWPDVSTAQEESASQHPRQRNPAQADPRGFQFSLNIPFAHNKGQSKETGSATKGLSGDGSGYASPSSSSSSSSSSYRPSSVHISSSFNTPSAPDGFPGKDPAKNPTGGKTAPEVTKPSFHFSLSVPIPPKAPPQDPSGSSGAGGYPGKPQTSGGFVQNGYVDPSKPYPGPPQGGSPWVHHGHGVQLQQLQQQQQIQMQQQISHVYEPLHTQYGEATQASFTPGHAVVHTPAPQHLSWAQTPKDPQSLKYPEPQHPHQQLHYVYGGQTSGHHYEGDRCKHQTSPPKQTHTHPPLPPSHYEGDLTVKPSGTSQGQRQTWQALAAPPAFDYAHYNYGHFQPATSPPVPPPQHKPPSAHYYTTQHLPPTKPYQYSRGQWGKQELDNRAHHAAYDHNYYYYHQQPPVTPDKLYTGGEKPDGNPDYTKLYLDVEDVTDGKYYYYGGYSGHDTSH